MMQEDDVHAALATMLLNSAREALVASEYDEAAEYARAAIRIRPQHTAAEELLKQATRLRFQAQPHAAEERQWGQLAERLSAANLVRTLPPARSHWLKTLNMMIGTACLVLVAMALWYQDSLDPLAARYGWAVPALLIAFKAAAIVFPPLTGGVIGLAGISFVGWKIALICDYFGTVLGAMAAFWVARRFQGVVLRWFPSMHTLNDGLEAKLSDGHYFRSFLIIRLFTEAIFDWLSYAAGLTRIPFREYVLATMLGCIPVKFILFYFARFGFDAGLVTAILLVGGIGILAIVSKPSKYFMRLVARRA